MAFRRLSRGRLRKKLRGRRTFRKAKRIIRRVRRKLKKRTARKARRKQHLMAYAYSTHVEAAFNTVAVDTLGTNIDNAGLLTRFDIDKLFDQVPTIDDFMYGGQIVTGAPGNVQRKANRHSLKIRVKSEVLYTMSNGNTAGGIFVQVFVGRPRANIPQSGIGINNTATMAEIYRNNLASLFQTDYNDAEGVAVNAAGTGGVTNIVQNATTTTKPTLTLNDGIWHTPFMVPEITQNFKILQVKKVFIPPGGVFMFKVKTPWQWIDRSEMQIRQGGSPLGEVYRPRQGRDVLLKAYGQPVHDQTTHTLVNVGRTTLDVIATKKYWFSASSKPVPRYYHSGNALGTVAGAQLPGDPDQVVGET